MVKLFRFTNIFLIPNVVVKVLNERLFLYFGEKAGHNWLKYIDTSKIDLGSGNRSITESGALVTKYHLILPKELV